MPTPPLILFIAREPLLAGCEAAYCEIEEETARLSAELGCPHPYLAMESLTGPREIWWFNGFDSREELGRVAEGYASNAPLSEALGKNRDRKAALTGPVTELTAHYRPDLSAGDPWIPGHARFLAIAVADERPSAAGTIYERGDGSFLVFSPARTRLEAGRLAASIPGSVVVEARPSLSFPAGDWVAADPRFWGPKR